MMLEPFLYGLAAPVKSFSTNQPTNQSQEDLLLSLLAVSSREDTLPTPPQSICVQGEDALPF